MLRAIITIWPLFLGIALIQSGNGLQASLLGVRASLEGFGTFTTGIVISGYLITSLIKKEILSRDKISYLNFLDRRIRRIIPLIIFVFLVFLPIAYIFLLPQNLMDFSKSILYSLGFSSNVYFFSSLKILARYRYDNSLFGLYTISFSNLNFDSENFFC